MSFFTRSRKAKASQSDTKKSQAPGDGSQATLVNSILIFCIYFV